MNLARVTLPLLATALLGACALVPGRARGDEPLDIIFVMVDDLGPEWIGACGGEGIETPALDRLAREGLRLTNAYSMPKCTPTRVTLLTGQYPWRHGWVNHWDVPRWGCGCHFDPDQNPSFARALRDAGYRTAVAGKWQINDFRVQPEVLEQHGFDEWCVWTGYETGNPPSGKRYQDPYLRTGDQSRTHPGEFGPDVLLEFVQDFLRRHRDEPKLVYWPMILTHGPLVATPREPGAEGKMDKHRAMVRHVDHLMGELRRTLDELDLSRRTLVVFTTDNGTSGGIAGVLNGRKVKGGKGKATENGCRAPFFVWGPGHVPAGVVSEALLDFSDLYPTFVDLAGAELPRGVELDGHSLAEVFLGRDTRGPRDWILAMGGGVAALREGRIVPAEAWAPRVLRDDRYKAWFENGVATRLYDLHEDSGEKVDLLSGADGAAAASLRRFEAAIATFPERDGVPRYHAVPPQAWDRTPGWEQAAASSADDRAVR